MERLRGWTIEVRPASGSPRIVATSASEWSWKGLGERAAFRADVRGTLRVPKDGAYSLVLKSDSAARLDVDGETILGAPGTRTVELARGCHSIEVVAVAREAGAHYVDLLYETKGSYSQVYLYWLPPGAAEKQLVPADRLRPAGPLEDFSAQKP